MTKLTLAEFVRKYPKSEIMENACQDLACSACGAREGFKISFDGTCLVFDEGSDDVGSHEWDEKSYCECQCGEHAKVWDFTIEGLDEFLTMGGP